MRDLLRVLRNRERKCWRAHSLRRQGLSIESLEPRQLLATNVVISELMAVNNGTLADEDGEFSDWLELHNTTAAPIDLDGYYLTDDAEDLTKWRLPAVTLDAGGYVVVFASDKDRDDPAGTLHTNFRLAAEGEPLALVRPDGVTIEHAYEPVFPEQLADVSYGLFGSIQDLDTLVHEEAPIRVLVPENGSLGTAWTAATFDASAWTEGDLGVGYDAGDGVLYLGHIATDVTTAMFGRSTSVYVRAEFDIIDPDRFESLTLKVRHDDGFIAYLNGVEVARRNAPVAATFDAVATIDRADEAALTFEEFDLSGLAGNLKSGTNVLAIQGLNDAADSVRFLIGAELTGLVATLGMPQYFTTPTPQAANVAGALGLVDDTEFSVDRGFYDAPFQVEVTTDTPGARIRYTLDGTAPSATSGLAYQGPIDVTTTTLLRAVAYLPGYISSNVDTQTYIFLEDVIGQDGTGLAPTANWGHAGPDYEVDPQIVGDARYADTIVDDLKSIPTISLVMDWDDWFGRSGQGIYVQGTGSPRAVSAELIHPDGTDGFQIDASVQIQGGTSTNRWKSDKLSMRLKFTEDYGPTKLEYHLFGDAAVDQFDTIILDAVLNYSWIHNTDAQQRNNAKFIQDQYVADLQNAVGGTAPHGTYSHLYLNGLYWGMYYVHERPDESFAAAYLGGDKDDYDVIKHRSSTVVNGTNSNYQALISAAGRNLATSQNYAAIAELLDVDDFIDYMIVNFYAGNTDWAHQNWYASYNRVDPAGRWRFHSWDAEHVLKSVNENVTDKNDPASPAYIHQRLTANAEYRLLFADHVQRHFFYDGPMTPANAAAAYEARMDQVDRAIVGESARWGDNRVSNPFTQDHWLATQNSLLQDYFPDRTARVLAQLRSIGLYPTIDAPVLGHRGGPVDAGFELTMRTQSGQIYYTLDGSDPRLAGGGISPNAVVVPAGAVGTVSINQSLVVRARSRSGNTWSAAIGEAEFFVGAATAASFAITEVHYHPHDPTTAELAIDPAFQNDDFEFVELKNVGNQAIDLVGVRFVEGIAFDFTDAGATSLEPGEFVLLVKSIAAFEARFGTGLPVAGFYDGQLSNGGERLLLVDRFGDPIGDFEFDDANGWPDQADGDGSSLAVVNTSGDYSAAANWRAAVPSPGADDDVPQLAGDFNGNGRVEQADLDLVLLHWGLAAFPAPVGWIHDPPMGQIDQDELDAVLLNWGATVAAARTAPAPPSALYEVAIRKEVAKDSESSKMMDGQNHGRIKERDGRHPFDPVENAGGTRVS